MHHVGRLLKSKQYSVCLSSKWLHCDWQAVCWGHTILKRSNWALQSKKLTLSWWSLPRYPLLLPLVSGHCSSFPQHKLHFCDMFQAWEQELGEDMPLRDNMWSAIEEVKFWRECSESRAKQRCSHSGYRTSPFWETATAAQEPKLTSMSHLSSVSGDGHCGLWGV